MPQTQEDTRLLGGLTVARFLREVWQKKPLLVRGAFPKFRDPITPDELAGLSCEDGVESRLVREKGGKVPWEVIRGPQEERVFSKLPNRGWTLLVQEVNRWVPEAALLLEPFSFLPNVRVDDVMVSFAAPGGSVGPHIDSYDVFLIQGQGRRRWRYGTRKPKDATFRPGLDLRILRRFDADGDEVLEPGDMLYLPPGLAHHGIAITSCLTYSVGFRATNAAEAWSSFAEWAGARNGDVALLEDPPFRAGEHPGAIPPKLLERARAMVRSIDMSDENLDRWFASFSTRLKPGHELVPPSRPPSLREVERAPSFVRSEEARWAFLPQPNKGLLLFVGGDEIAVSERAAPLARELAGKRRHEGRTIRELMRDRASRDLFMRLLRIGAVLVPSKEKPRR